VTFAAGLAHATVARLSSIHAAREQPDLGALRRDAAGAVAVSHLGSRKVFSR
jgi:hypothetical protein